MISTLVLALSANLLGGDGHADLHPSDAELFLELPDATALVAAYDGAPMVQTFRDEAVRSFFAGLPVDPAHSLKSIGTMLVPGRDLTAVFAGVEAVSLSASLGTDPARPELLAFQAVLDLASPDLAAQVLRGLHELVAVETSAEGPTSFTFEQLPGVPCWSLLEESRLVLGGGRATPEAYAARRRGEGASWTSSALARSARERLSHAGGAVVVRAQQSRSPLETLVILGGLASGGDAAVEIFAGLDPFAGPSAFEMRLVGSRFVTEVFSPAGEGAAGASAVALDPTWLSRLPADVVAFYSCAFDAAAISEGGRKLLAASGLEGSAEELETKVGFPLEQLFGRMGPGLLGYVLPLAGIGVPPTYLWIELREPAEFSAALEAFCAKLPELVPGASAETRDYRPKNAATGERERIPVTSIQLPPGTVDLGPLSVSPSLAVVGDRLVLGTSAMSLKKELKRFFEEPATAAGPPAELGIAPGTRSVLWVDWGGLIEGVVEIVRGLGSLLSGFGELPFDPKALPNPQVFTRAMQPTVHTSRRVDGGILRRHEASFGPETWLALGATAYGLWTGQALAAPVTPPAPSAGAEVDATAMRLADLRTGLAVFQLAAGSYPESLAELVVPTADYPQGFLEGASVPVDGWGRAFHYARGEGSYILRSLGADGIDQGGDGDDVALD